MRWQLLTLTVLALVVYLAVGGLVFWFLESAHDTRQELQEASTSNKQGAAGLRPDEMRTDVETELKRFLLDLVDRKVAQDNKDFSDATVVCLSKLDVLSFVANWTWIHEVDANKRHQQQWNLPGSVFFAITVVTTIGYGNLVPRSPGGRVFCCLYAVIGIPLSLVVIVNIGDRLNAMGRWLERLVTTRFHTAPRRHLGRYGRSAALAGLGSLVFLFLPAAVFSHLQTDWSYGDALYFAVISLSTVGFGDYVAGINYEGPLKPVYRLLVGVWIFCGLAWLAGVMSGIVECFQALAKHVDERLPLNGGKKRRKQKQAATAAAAAAGSDGEPDRFDCDVLPQSDTTSVAGPGTLPSSRTDLDTEKGSPPSPTSIPSVEMRLTSRDLMGN